MNTWNYVFFLLFTFQSYAQVSDFKGVNFQKADRIALECKQEGLDNLPQLAHKLTANLTTDAERFRAIYMWVCSNVANDYKLYLKNKRKRQRFKNDSLKLETWNTHFKKIIFKKLLQDKKTICTGYAYLIAELSNLANLNCEIVHGYGRTSTINTDQLDTPNHSWNAIELNGKWYLCDPTWASGIPDSETHQFTFQYNDGYFLTNPKLFAINHYPLDTKWFLLTENIPSFEDFLDAPILYGNAYSHLKIHNAPKKMHSNIHKNEKVTFTYELKNPVLANQVRLLIDNGNTDKKTTPTTLTIEDQSLSFDYQFMYTGFYDVHLYIDDCLIATYTVMVKS